MELAKKFENVMIRIPLSLLLGLLGLTGTGYAVKKISSSEPSSAATVVAHSMVSKDEYVKDRMHDQEKYLNVLHKIELRLNTIETEVKYIKEHSKR